MARGNLFLGLAFLTGCAAQRPAQDSAEPAAQPSAMVLADTSVGNQLYHTTGNCASCHGDGGVGTPDGPQLVSGTWKLGDGSYDWLRHIVRHGGWGMTDRDDEPRPMRGPTALDSTQVRQVATYVWSISRNRRPPSN